MHSCGCFRRYCVEAKPSVATGEQLLRILSLVWFGFLSVTFMADIGWYLGLSFHYLPLLLLTWFLLFWFLMTTLIGYIFPLSAAGGQWWRCWDLQVVSPYLASRVFGSWFTSLRGSATCSWWFQLIPFPSLVWTHWWFQRNIFLFWWVLFFLRPFHVPSCVSWLPKYLVTHTVCFPLELVTTTWNI